MCILVFSTYLPGQRTWGGGYIDFRIANDVLYLPIKTDQYFTSGISLEVGKKTEVAPLLRTTTNAVQNRYWRFTQNIYTPREIESSVLLTNDRPFASYLIATHGKSYTDALLGFSIETAWTAGILGKYSGGGSMQNALHEMLSFADPLPGWIYEVKPDVILNYEVGLAQHFRLGPHLLLTTGLKTRLGTLYTNINPEVTSRWRAVRFNESRYLQLEITGNARLVGYDATLSGGLINRDRRYRGIVHPQSLVGQFGVNGEIRYDGLRLMGGVSYLSPEFAGGLPHAWAWMGFRVMPGWRQFVTSRPSNLP